MTAPAGSLSGSAGKGLRFGQGRYRPEPSAPFPWLPGPVPSCMSLHPSFPVPRSPVPVIVLPCVTTVPTMPPGTPSFPSCKGKRPAAASTPLALAPGGTPELLLGHPFIVGVHRGDTGLTPITSQLPPPNQLLRRKGGCGGGSWGKESSPLPSDLERSVPNRDKGGSPRHEAARKGDGMISVLGPHLQPNTPELLLRCRQPLTFLCA